MEGSDKEVKSKTIPSALGKNRSSRESTIDMPDFTGRKRKKPIHVPARIDITSRLIDATYLDPNLDFFSTS